MSNPRLNLGPFGQAFAVNMRVIRKARGLTLTQVRDRLEAAGHHLTHDQLIRIEAGQRHATVDDIGHIAAVLKAPAMGMLLPRDVVSVPRRSRGRVAC
ncbi:helix-turn-helix domain-containing protein [Nocardia farcinica]|uniref:helix-turn-helix domain-containing protein n=1 Tax=Nocardia farcinica TaxID=37329 RepID=UPI0024553835|nr:helix-turn-helix transcriptional regulator [Nocardia farcinica]